jgi:hypothetical protein
METKSSTFKSIFPVGIILAIIMTLYSSILLVMGVHEGPLSWVSWVILICGIFYGTKRYRDGECKGYISYGTALKSSILIVLIAAVFLSLFILIYSSVEPSFQQTILDNTRQKMEEKGGMSDEQIEMSLKYTKMFTTPVMMGIWTLVMYMLFGLILSLIIAAIVKKDNPNPFAEIVNQTV